jgi:hypothetical protein
LLLTVPGSLRRRRELARLRKDLERIQAAVNPDAGATTPPELLMPMSPL